MHVSTPLSHTLSSKGEGLRPTCVMFARKIPNAAAKPMSQMKLQHQVKTFHINSLRKEQISTQQPFLASTSKCFLGSVFCKRKGRNSARSETLCFAPRASSRETYVFVYSAEAVGGRYVDFVFVLLHQHLPRRPCLDVTRQITLLLRHWHRSHRAQVDAALILILRQWHVGATDVYWPRLMLEAGHSHGLRLPP